MNDIHTTKKRSAMTTLISKLFGAIEKPIRAVCIIEERGGSRENVWNRKTPSASIVKVAWTKASQMWLTGVKTGEYERMVFTGENANGIKNPDWLGRMANRLP